MRCKKSLQAHEVLSLRLSRTKIFQTLLAFINIVTSAYLLGYLSSRNIDLNGALPVSVIMASVTLVVTMANNWFGRHFNGFAKRGCVVLFLCGDIICIGLQVPAIAVLGAAGLPWKCTGITSQNDGPFDANGFSNTNEATLLFSDGQRRGILDGQCGLPKSYFALSIMLLISYFYTIGVSIRLIVALSRLSKAMKAQGEAQNGSLGQNGDMALTQTTPGTGPRPRSEAPNPQGFIQVTLPRGDEKIHEDSPEERSWAGSWTSETPNPSTSPPPYDSSRSPASPRLGKK